MTKHGAISLSLSALLALGIALPSSARAAQMPDLCKQGSDLDPGFQRPEEPCQDAEGGRGTCEATTRKLKQWETEYRGLIQQACNNGKNFKPATGTDQKQALQQNLSVLQQAKSSIDTLIKKNVDLLNKEIPQQGGRNVQAMRQKLQEERSRPRTDPTATSRISDAENTLQKSENLFRPQNGESFRNDQVSEADVNKVQLRDPRAQAKALHHSSVFARKLLVDGDQRRRTAAELDSMISQTQAALNKQGAAEGEKKDEKGGLDAKDAAGLAGAAAPLAQAAQKKDGADSGITGNTSTDPYSAANYSSTNSRDDSTSPSATNATGDGNANPKNSVSLNGTKSTSPSSKGTSDPLGLASGVSNNSATPFSASYGNTSGAGSGSSSDRAARGDASGLIGVSSGKILGGGGAKPGDVFGAGKREPASTMVAKPGAEDALDSFAGGGSLNYGNSHGSSTAPPSEDGMKEMLEDMGEVVDSYDEGYDQGYDQELQADGVGAAEGEDLFRRISACYVRSVKGGLLN